jgi:preprotein translocase subunit Sec63
MSFRDFERVLGALLPKSAHRAEWWANEQSLTTRHVQCKA